jgi:hypothetical protein
MWTPLLYVSGFMPPWSEHALGLKWSEDAKHRNRGKRIGRKLSSEHKANIGAGHLGQKRSEKAVASMSAAQTKRFEDPAERAKVSERRMGIVFSAEHIENIRRYQRNRPKEPRLGHKGSGGKSVICVETGQVFASMGLAFDWLKSIGKTKAKDRCKGYAGISLAANGHRKYAYGFTWSFAT